MKITFLSLIFCLAVTNNSYSQTTFSKLYTSNDSLGFGYSIAIDDSAYYIVGLGNVDFMGVAHLDLFFLKTDYYGNRIIAKYYYKDIANLFLPGNYNNLIVVNNSVLYSGAYESFDTLFPINEKFNATYYKFDKNGDTILTKRFNGRGYSDFNDIGYLSNDSSKYLLGYTRDTSIYDYYTYIIKLDANDSVLWEKTYREPFKDETGNSVELLNGDTVVVFSNYYYDELDINIDGKINQINALTGTETFEFKTGTLGRDQNFRGTVTTDKNYVVATQIMDTLINPGDYYYTSSITKMDLSGNIVWRKYFNNPYIQFFYTVRCFEDGSIVAVGIKVEDTTEVYHGYICKLNADGELLWEHTYSNNPLYYHLLFDFQKTPDGGYIVSGAGADGVEDAYEGPMWLLKLDSMGCLNPYCGDVAINDDLDVQEGAFTIYPNPITAMGVAEITVPQNLHLNNDVTFSVNFLDLNGRVVSSYNNIAPLNAGAIIRFNVNLSDLPAGIYMAQLSYGATPVETTKVVVVR